MEKPIIPKEAYAISIVTSNFTDEKQILTSVNYFISTFKIAFLLRQCGLRKVKGIPVMELFTYILSNIFRSGSFYMQQRIGDLKKTFSKNTYYRFFLNAHANWLRFTTLLSANIVNKHLRPLTSEDRDDCFIIDDTLYNRAGVKSTELAARVFDHTDMKYRKGYRLLTLGWSDGCSFVPINCSLLSSPSEANILGKKKYDKCSLCGRRRIMATSKATNVMVELLKQALNAGHRAKYVLFDSWFSHPRNILDIVNLGQRIITMVKRSSKVSYLFEGKRKNIKQIFAESKKRRGRSKYLLSVPVKICVKGEEELDARIVCVRSRNNRKDRIALICTDMSLSEEDIIRIYGKRWDIEVFFKTSKSYLQLTTGYHGLSYDALTAYVSMVFARYMLLAVAKRNNEDERTLGELFYIMVKEVADMTFNESMAILVKAMLSAVQSVFMVTDSQTEVFIERFMEKLPSYMRSCIQQKVAVKVAA